MLINGLIFYQTLIIVTEISMKKKYKDWPKPCRNMLMLCIFAVIATVVIFLFFLQPKWKQLQESRSEFASAEKKLQDSPWPKDSERLRTLQNSYRRTLGSKGKGGLIDFTEKAMKKATGIFKDKIIDEYGTYALFIDKASQIEYRDQYDRMFSTFQTRRIYLDKAVLGMDESTVEDEKYKMLLKIWTLEKLVNLALEHKLKICDDYSVRTGSHKQYYAAKLNILPEKAYILDEENKIPFLLEFPVRMTVRCTMEDFLSFTSALQSEELYLPLQQMEITVDTSGNSRYIDDDGVLSFTNLEITMVCSSFFRISEDAARAKPSRGTLPLLPPGA